MLLQSPALILIVLALATWRAAYMVTSEEGPFGIFQRLRGAVDPDQRTWLGRGINCIYCVSFWAAWALLPLAYVWWGQWLVVGLAASGAAIGFQHWIHRR